MRESTLKRIWGEKKDNFFALIVSCVCLVYIYVQEGNVGMATKKRFGGLFFLNFLNPKASERQRERGQCLCDSVLHKRQQQ